MPRDERRGRTHRARAAAGAAPAGPVPELLRRALSLGFSGFAMTESALRRALGESVPRDWVDFVVEQSERARSDFLDRLSFEIATSLEKLDLAAVAQKLLEGRHLEFKIEVRLRDDGEGRSPNNNHDGGDPD
jgi:hypothetical protein